MLSVLGCQLSVVGFQLILEYYYKSKIINPFFFLDEKETKNQDLGFSAIKIGSLPKTQKLSRSFPRGIKQFEFLYGSFAFLILACQIQWSKKSPLVPLKDFGIYIIRAVVAKSKKLFLVYFYNLTRGPKLRDEQMERSGINLKQFVLQNKLNNPLQ